MNFIQRDPNDPRYGEFHNGENEIWAVVGGTKRKKIKIPSALASGLELIAAAVATGLLAWPLHPCT